MSHLFHHLTASDQALAIGNAAFTRGDLTQARRMFEQAHILGASAKTAYNIALACDELRQYADAERHYEVALDYDPGYLEARVNYGNLLRRDGRLRDARHHHTIAIGLAASNPVAQYNLGVSSAKLGLHGIARPLLAAAATALPEFTLARNALKGLSPEAAPPAGWDATCPEALAAVAAGRDTDAERHFRSFLDRNPHSAVAWTDLAAALMRLGRSREAIEFLQRSLTIKPSLAATHHNLAYASLLVGRTGEAKDYFYQAIACDPSLMVSWTNLAELLVQQDDVFRAWEVLYAPSRWSPPPIDVMIAFAEASYKLKKTNLALETMARLGQILPDNFLVHNNSGTYLLQQGKLAQAIESFEKASCADPNSAMVAGNLGACYEIVHRYQDALKQYERAMSLDHDNLTYVTRHVHVSQHLGAWDGLAERFARIAGADPQELAHAQPFALLSIPGVGPETHLSVARLHAQKNFPPREPKHRSRPPGHRIRVGYLSADFYDHPTTWLLVEVLELHDRSKYEIFAYSSSPETTDLIGRRVRSACDAFVDIAHLSDERAAERIAADGIDILVDVKGYTLNTRSGVLSYRPARIQINYLAYPGTMGADYVDYIIGDPIVTPPAHDRFYSESVLRMRHCYQPNDRRRPRPDTPPRGECDLPEDAFVFCSFNNAYKLTPDVFRDWCTILDRVPNSVLWLLTSNPVNNDNIRKAAAGLGVDPGRIVFAPRLKLEPHLARYGLADLFLDTFPYTAHTTASDALWCGVPVLTRLGDTFASRVAASILSAAGLEDLITHSRDAYVALAVKIATEPSFHAALKRRIDENRLTCPLFDSVSYTRDLENLYQRCVSSEARHAV